MFFTPNTNFNFWVTMILSSANALNLVKAKILLFGKELNSLQCTSCWDVREIDWMVFYAAFNSISVISWRQFSLFMYFLGFTSTRLGSEVSCPRTLPRKAQRIRCGSNPRPLDYESNTLPLSHVGWLVVLGFNATLTARVISWQSVMHMFPGFLTTVLTQLFFPKPPTTFLTCFCRGERRKYAGKKSHLNQGSNSQPPGHESDTLTTEPPGRGSEPCGTLRCERKEGILLQWLSAKVGGNWVKLK